MNDTRPQVVRGYLRELDGALAGAPADLRRDILDGVAADLDGLEPAAAAERIEQLGDPALIAAEAGERMPRAAAHAGAGAGADAHEASAPPVSPRWYVVVTAVVVAFGGFVVPVVGWVVGIAMMWLSNAWLRWEKWVATLLPVALAAVLLLVDLVAAWVGSWTTATPPGAAATDPVLPAGLLGWHASLLVVLVSPVIAGVWLLVRGLRRP
ncbi:HAAS signaling domain-containing protein [Agromyces sp. MMS24-K17]|uniref:HAAS signaling domain-containing protein n=1 Tax=Agromyces sp. MMS24-K17 TaxID=3372850 RepID=UPI003754CD6D